MIAHLMPVCYNPDMHKALKLNIRPYQVRDQEAVVDLWKNCGLVVAHNDPWRDIERKCRVNPEWFQVLAIILPRMDRGLQI